jgi:hypothetical protein
MRSVVIGAPSLGQNSGGFAMSASAERFCSPGQSRTTMRGLEKWNTADTARRFVAADMMPRGTGVILPQRAGIEPELQWVSDDRSVVNTREDSGRIGHLRCARLGRMRQKPQQIRGEYRRPPAHVQPLPIDAVYWKRFRQHRKRNTVRCASAPS